MERNLDRRVETMHPVRDPDLLAHLRDVVLNAYLRDTVRAMVLDSSGRYNRPPADGEPFNAQQYLLKYYTGARRRRYELPAAGQERRPTRPAGDRRASGTGNIDVVTTNAIGPIGQSAASTTRSTAFASLRTSAMSAPTA
jgi:hypothetical protein